MTPLAAHDAYRRWASTYDQENAVTALECGLVGRLSRSPLGLRLLDVGCGTGRRLVDTGAALAVGVEPCAEMLAAGRAARDFGPEVRLLAGDARALPVPDGAFDLLWCRLMIGHVERFETVFGELGRAAAAGAQLVVTDFHPSAYAAGLRRTFRDEGELIEVEHHVHSRECQVAAAAAAGLRLVETAEAVIGPAVRHFYEQAGKTDLFERQLGLPVVIGLSFERAG